MPDNTITIIGNLTRDPELRFTNNGVARATLGIAVNHRFNNRATNEWEERPSFFNAVCWRDLAQNVSDSLARGNRVVVTGRLEQRSWETQDGEKRSIIEIIADEVAPSLRWATAKIERTQSGGGQGGSGGGGQGAAQSGTAQSGTAQSGTAQGSQDNTPASGAASSGGGQVSQDEEPF